MTDYKMIRVKPGQALRILLPGLSGTVEIRTDLATANGSPRMRVDVQSDQPRFGPVAEDGLTYVVENGDPGPGVVFLTGQRST